MGTKRTPSRILDVVASQVSESKWGILVTFLYKEYDNQYTKYAIATEIMPQPKHQEGNEYVNFTPQY